MLENNPSITNMKIKNFNMKSFTWWRTKEKTIGK